MIRNAGFVRSVRRERHASYIQVWELADRPAAERWLQDHPDMPDPDEDRGEGSQRILFPIDNTNEPTPTVGAAGAESQRY